MMMNLESYSKSKPILIIEMAEQLKILTKLQALSENFLIRKAHSDFDASAVAKVVEYSSRIAERQDKISTRFNQIAEILGEAATWAKIDNATFITARMWIKLVAEKEQRLAVISRKTVRNAR